VLGVWMMVVLFLGLISVLGVWFSIGKIVVSRLFLLMLVKVVEGGRLLGMFGMVVFGVKWGSWYCMSIGGCGGGVGLYFYLD